MYMNNLVDAVHGVNMTVKEDVIKAMKEAGKPMSAGEVEKATGIDRNRQEGDRQGVQGAQGRGRHRVPRQVQVGARPVRLQGTRSPKPVFPSDSLCFNVT